jgi:hypothetical protein
MRGKYRVEAAGTQESEQPKSTLVGGEFLTALATPENWGTFIRTESILPTAGEGDQDELQLCDSDNAPAFRAANQARSAEQLEFWDSL